MTKLAPPQEPIIALVRDLLFGSNISAAARGAGVAVRMLRDASKLAETDGRMLLVDLALDGAIAAAGEWGKATGNPVIGFVSHVDTDTAAKAEAAGIRVMTRGQFSAALPELLKTAG
jgi:hypothetical protein